MRAARASLVRSQIWSNPLPIASIQRDCAGRICEKGSKNQIPASTRERSTDVFGSSRAALELSAAGHAPSWGSCGIRM